MRDKPPLFRLIERALGESPADLIERERRSTNDDGSSRTPTPFRQIAFDIQSKTGEEVSDQAVQRWYAWRMAEEI